MDSTYIIFLILGISVLIYVLSYIKKRPTAILTFLCRLTVGLVYIYIFNSFCSARGLSTYIGINLPTALVSGILGLPGVMLLYMASLFLQCLP